jgi:hypothetical protein
MQTYVRKAKAEGFRIHANWDPAEAERLFGSQAAQYLRDVEALADGFRLVDSADHAAYADSIRAAVRETDADHVWHVGSEESAMLAYEVADELGKATGSEDAAQAPARADRVRELIKVEVAASAPAGEVVAR